MDRSRIAFSTDAIDRLLEQQGERIDGHARDYIRRVIQDGPQRLDPYALNQLCKDLGVCPAIS